MSKTIVHDTPVRIVCLGGELYCLGKLETCTAMMKKATISISIGIYWRGVKITVLAKGPTADGIHSRCRLSNRGIFHDYRQNRLIKGHALAGMPIPVCAQ